MPRRHFHTLQARRHQLPIPTCTPEMQEAAMRAVRRALRAHFDAQSCDRLPVHFVQNPLVLDAMEIPRRPAPDRAEPPEDPNPFGGGEPDARPVRGYRERVRRFFEESAAETVRGVGPLGAPFDRNLRTFARELGLDALERDLLALLVLRARHPVLTGVLNYFPLATYEHVVALLATVLDARPSDVRARLLPDAPLRASGLVRVDEEPDETLSVTLDRRVAELAGDRGLRRASILTRFLTEEPEPVLALSDFGRISRDVDAALRILRGALDRREPGVNILLAGPTGTGKTELARVLARELGAKLYLAGAADESGASPSADERFASLRLGHRLLQAVRAISLFDETQDAFEQDGFFPGLRPARVSKVWLTRLLEKNPIPTIWTTNDAGSMDPAYLRRMTFALRFEALGPGERRGVWKRFAGQELAAGDLEGYADAYEVSPAEIASALRAARLAGNGALDRGVLERVLEGQVRIVLGRPRTPARRPGGAYRLDAVNASADLVRLVASLSAWSPGAGPGPALLLYGPPGTGKSAFVQHLAEQMKRRLVVRHGSDLLGMYVGQTEKAIAAAFLEAEEDGAVLLFDEVDGHLQDRRGARHSWEVSFVNEFLQRLEGHRGIVACTTNLLSTLDPAALRRFSVKIEFRPLRPEQALAQFEVHLATLLATPPDEAERARIAGLLRRVPGLVPGDYAAVRRRFAIEGGPVEADALVAALEAEVRLRGSEARAIGF